MFSERALQLKPAPVLTLDIEQGNIRPFIFGRLGHPMHTATTIFLCTVMSPLHYALADRAAVGAASRCTPNGFAVEGIVESSAGNIHPSAGAVKLTKRWNTLRCSIAKAHIEARVYVSPPSETGACSAAGTVWIETLKINGKNYMKEPGYINNYCSSHPTYSRVEVIADGGFLTVNLCTGTWDWGDVFENETCEKIVIDNPALQGILSDKAAQRP